LFLSFCLYSSFVSFLYPSFCRVFFLFVNHFFLLSHRQPHTIIMQSNQSLMLGAFFASRYPLSHCFPFSHSFSLSLWFPLSYFDIFVSIFTHHVFFAFFFFSLFSFLNLRSSYFTAFNLDLSTQYVVVFVEGEDDK